MINDLTEDQYLNDPVQISRLNGENQGNTPSWLCRIEIYEISALLLLID